MNHHHPADDRPSGEPARRWRRRAAVAGTAATVALVIAGGAVALRSIDRGGAAAGVADPSSPTGPTTEATHALSVRTAVVPDVPIAYDEGALLEVDLVPTSPGIETPRRRGPADAGDNAVWTDLPAGSYVMTIATRPCHGNCGYLDPATDACRGTVDLDADTEVVVRIHWAEPCVITEVSS